MIFILFITLAIVYYMVQYMEKRRRDRNEEQQDRRRNSFLNLLQSLKEKDEKAVTQNKHENET